ncbi:MAG: flagellar basal body rod protein FlgB [Burkholderiales bacterium]|nr:flagellar basal body rod protein FlgB [Burkholderiales bacterium]
MRLRDLRTEVLAGNIANADTPWFKARDFDFRSALTQAKHGAGIAMARTAARHLDGKADGAAALGVKLLYRVPSQPSIDGNTVELDSEVARFSENALRQQASFTFLNSRLRGLQQALAPAQ